MIGGILTRKSTKHKSTKRKSIQRKRKSIKQNFMS